MRKWGNFPKSKMATVQIFKKYFRTICLRIMWNTSFGYVESIYDVNFSVQGQCQMLKVMFKVEVCHFFQLVYSRSFYLSSPIEFKVLELAFRTSNPYTSFVQCLHPGSKVLCYVIILSQQHGTMSYANTIHYGEYVITFSVNMSINMRNRYLVNADSWCSQPSRQTCYFHQSHCVTLSCCFYKH